MSIHSILGALLLVLPLAAAAQTTGAPAATQALLAGDMVAAERLSLAVLVQDPDNRPALIALAGASVETGGFARGYDAARLAFRLSASALQRYESARLAALLAARDGRFLVAQVWLRRALIAAPTPEAEAQTGRDLALIRRQAPVAVNLSFTASPSSNVNGGSEDEFNVIDGFPVVGVLSPDARALSGWSGTLDGRLTFRVDESRTHRTTATLRLNARGVLLSEEALAFIAAETDEDDPEITNGDFASGLIEAGVTHLFQLPRGSGQVDLTLGRGFLGTDDAYTFLRLTGQRRWALTGGQGVDLQASAERRSPDGDSLLENRYGLSGTWTLPVADSGRLGLTLSLAQTDTVAINNASTGWTAAASWTPRAAVGPAEISLQAGFQFTDYPDYAVIFPVPGGRQDERRFASISAALPGQAWAGFVPVVTLRWEDVDSNVSRFARDGFGLDLALRSAF